jgi:hypothetical protein
MNAEYSGFSTRDSYNNIGYIILFKNGKIRDLYTLVHEIFHIIIKQQTIPGYFTDDKVFLSEVEGAFADLIVTDYLKEKGIYLDDARNIELLNFDTIRHFIRNLNISHNYSNIMDGNSFSITKIKPIPDTRDISVYTKSQCDASWFGLCQGTVIYSLSAKDGVWKVSNVYALEE